MDEEQQAGTLGCSRRWLLLKTCESVDDGDIAEIEAEAHAAVCILHAGIDVSDLSRVHQVLLEEECFLLEHFQADHDVDLDHCVVDVNAANHLAKR